MKRYVAEFLGTFGLIFCGTGSMVINDVTSGTISHVGVAITWGLIVTAMVYTFGRTSGAHINPAVTIAFTITNLFNKKLIPGYIVAQLLGAFAASFLLKILFLGHDTLGATLPFGSWWQSFIIEILLTYFLVSVVLFVSQDKEIAKYTGILAGIVVGLEAMFAGPITGASMNPARSIAPAIVSGNVQHLWIYIAAPIIGAILASYTWMYLKEDS